mmetsp:Transcript_7091/g.12429  ORF Transcript_7091/g.12429 Transcript_7091/m.12429 type:complete len:518 (+) Transcript_7091:89-1642(+)
MLTLITLFAVGIALIRAEEVCSVCENLDNEERKTKCFSACQARGADGTTDVASVRAELFANVDMPCVRACLTTGDNAAKATCLQEKECGLPAAQLNMLKKLAEQKQAFETQARDARETIRNALQKSVAQCCARVDAANSLREAAGKEGASDGGAGGSIELNPATSCLVACSTKSDQQEKIECAKACLPDNVQLPTIDATTRVCLEGCAAAPDAKVTCAHECTGLTVPPRLADLEQCFSENGCVAKASTTDQQVCGIQCVSKNNEQLGDVLQCGAACLQKPQAEQHACNVDCATMFLSKDGQNPLIACAGECAKQHADDDAALRVCATECAKTSFNLPSDGPVACAAKCGTDHAGDNQAIQACAVACVTNKAGGRRRAVEQDSAAVAADTSKCPACVAHKHRVFRLKIACAKLAKVQARVESFAATQFAELVLEKKCDRKRDGSAEGDLVVAANDDAAAADAQLFVATLDGVEGAEEVDDTPQGNSIYEQDSANAENNAQTLAVASVVSALMTTAALL